MSILSDLLSLPGEFTSYPKSNKPTHYREAGKLYIPGSFQNPSSEVDPATKTRPSQRNIGKKQNARDDAAGGADISDPWNAHYFKLEINGKEVAHFYECSGFKTSCDPAKIEEGGYNTHVHLRPAPSKWTNIVLKYGTSSDMEMVKWRNEILSGNYDKRTAYSGCVTLCDGRGEPLRKYNFINAWPVSWEGPALNAGSSELAIETIELAHDGIWIE
jgi:phage tail-like protein